MRARCNDIDVAWYEVGRGEPLILIHGLADDHRAWRRALPGLLLRHRVLMYDLRGHGGTSLGRPEGTLTQLGADLASLMDAAGVDGAHIAGFSLGGTIAMRMAIDHPARVRGLVLVATSSRVGRAAADWYQQRVDIVTRNDPQLRATLDRDAADVYAESASDLRGQQPSWPARSMKSVACTSARGSGKRSAPPPGPFSNGRSTNAAFMPAA